MAEPASDAPLRQLAERVVLAALGAVALTADRVEALADAFAERGALQRDEAVEVIDELMSRWRGDASRLSERAGVGLEGAFRQVGLVTRSEYEQLELRLAQLEHRLRLLEATAGEVGTTSR